MKIKILALTIFIISGASIYAQESGVITPIRENLLPVSPNAASLGAYGQVAVNLYTGRINPSIPIYQVKVKDFELPISINYNSNGLKVSEIPTRVGLGWSLSAGGVITRNMIGVPDETANGYSGANSIGSIIEANAVYTDEELKYFQEGTWDTGADEFYFNFLGHSGKFIRTLNKNYVSVPFDNLKITSNTDNLLSAFTIIDEAGVKYYFEDFENTITESNGSPTSGPFDYISAWYLSKIEFLNGIVIDFTYSNLNLNQPESLSETRYQLIRSSTTNTGFSPPCSMSDSETRLVPQIQGLKQLSRIDFPTGYVEFKDGEVRQDVTGNYGNTLGSIEIHYTDGNLFKKVDFSYDYVGSSIDESKRLILRSVSEQSLVHSIEYYNENGSYPSFDIDNNSYYSQDLWGYYNGVNNTSLIPATTVDVGDPEVSVFTMGSADRTPNAAKSIYGLIKKITYPTGGTTEFQFEPNDYFNQDDLDVCDITRSSNVETGFSSINDGNASLQQMPLINTLVVEFDQCVAINYSISATDLEGGGEASAYVELKGVINGQNFNWSKHVWSGADPNAGSGAESNESEAGTEFLVLKTGTYTLISFGEELPIVKTRATVDVSFNTLDDIGGGDPQAIAGLNLITTGLRIKLQKDCSGATNCLTTKYSYTLEGSLNSSGFIQYHPQYNFEFSEAGPLEGYVTYECDYYVINSSSQIPLSTTQGNSVGYRTVIAEKINNAGISIGTTVQDFSSAFEYPDNVLAIFPFPPPLNYDYKRGKPIGSKINSLNGDLLKYDINTYQFLNSANVVSGIKVGLKTKMVNSNEADEYAVEEWDVKSEWSYLTKANSTIYSGGSGEALTSETNYFYDSPNHGKLARKSSLNSDNTISTVFYKYPIDYANTGSTNVYGKMEVANIWKPVEQITEKTDKSGNEKVVAETMVEYSENNGLFTPETLNQLESDQPVDDFNLGTPDNPIADYRIKTRKNYVFDDKGGIIEESTPESLIVSYVWGYGGNFIIAQISNSESSAINTILTASDLLILNDVSALDDDVSLIANKLRTNLPPNTMITSYIYDVLAGLKSTTDPNGMVTTYKYDVFGRLIEIRDHNNQILKSYEYHYSNEN